MSRCHDTASNGVRGRSIIQISEVLTTLASKRPIFHSEAEFQHALAWEIHEELPSASLRLELPVEVKNQCLHMDIWAITADEVLAIELKYKTRGLSVQVDGEDFFLKDQSAQDIGRYDFLKDIRRLEQVTTERRNATGYAILLTNDSAYWTRPTNPHTVYADFRVDDGRILEGALDWGVNAGPGTTKGREQPVVLRDKYLVKWENFSRPSSASYGLFRSLIVKVVQGQEVG
jgi:hypothetical protein